MKVLFISGAIGADYQCDVIFHGLRSLLGPGCVDSNKMWFMYDTSPHYMFHSLYKTLPEIDLDRSDIQRRIMDKEFDCIVYGSVHRCRSFLGDVLAVYPANRIAYIDGEDDSGICGEALGRGRYFKRELQSDDPQFLPIQFGIPEEKILPIDLSIKTRLLAPCDPRDRSTYQYYDSEARYYRQYAESFFGYTMKKGGWDSMRHYEVISSGCVPYFDSIENAHPKTMAKFSREDFLAARQMCDSWNGSVRSEWLPLARKIQDHLRQHLTTKALARYVLEQMA